MIFDFGCTKTLIKNWNIFPLKFNVKKRIKFQQWKRWKEWVANQFPYLDIWCMYLWKHKHKHTRKEKITKTIKNWINWISNLQGILISNKKTKKTLQERKSNFIKWQTTYRKSGTEFFKFKNKMLKIYIQRNKLNKINKIGNATKTSFISIRPLTSNYIPFGTTNREDYFCHKNNENSARNGKLCE